MHKSTSSNNINKLVFDNEKSKQSSLNLTVTQSPDDKNTFTAQVDVENKNEIPEGGYSVLIQGGKAIFSFQNSTLTESSISKEKITSSKFSITLFFDRLCPIFLIVDDHTVSIYPDIKTENNMFIIRTKHRGERSALEKLQKANTENFPVMSAFFPHDDKNNKYMGYWMLESPMSMEELLKQMYSLRIPGKIIGTIEDINEIRQYFYEDEHLEYKIGDRVKIITSPFKNENASIISIEEDTIVVELSNAGLPIPITLNTNEIILIKSV